MSDQAVVTLKDVDVEFHGKTRSVHAVDHVDLTVNRGDIYGIVGYSGAGKSTLVRTINLLQRPTGGSVNVLGQDSYPAQLSGGQKQRVGIARALASDPEILISDEATSALDPKTTSSILELLQSLNQRLGLTIVLITHQMEAVKQICNRVAVMDDGAIIERGDLLQVFSNPQQQLTKDFIDTTLQLDQAIDAVMQQPTVKNLGPDDRLLRLTYVGDSADQPLVAKLFSSYHVTANILFGDIQILQDTPFGNLIVVLSGDHDEVEAGIAYLKQQDVKIEDILKKEA